MPHLYIANCTLQNRVVNFRIPEVNKAIQLTIARGRQVRVSSQELNPIQITSIVEQLSVFGARLVEHLGKKTTREERIPYIISSGNPVPATLIAKMLKDNQSAIKESGARFRKEAALASSEYIENQAPETLRLLDTVIAEDTPGTIENNDDPISEGLRVVGSANKNDEHRETQQRRGNNRRNNGRE